jgi:hypothetical protein
MELYAIERLNARCSLRIYETVLERHQGYTPTFDSAR